MRVSLSGYHKKKDARSMGQLLKIDVEMIHGIVPLKSECLERATLRTKRIQ